MAFLRTVPLGVFLFSLSMVLLLAGGIVAAAIAARRKAAALAGATALAPRDLAAGYRLVTGRATGPALTAPLTGRPCAWYEARIWESQRDQHDGKGEWRWREILSQTPERGIAIGDGRVSCLVRHAGAEVHGSGWSEWTGPENPPAEKNPPLRSADETPGGGVQASFQGTLGPRFRFRETIIAPGAMVYALGDCSPADPLPLAEGEEPEELDLYPEEVDASWVIRKAKGRPFLVTTRPPASVGAEAELAGKAAAPFALALAALALFMIWARFTA